MKRISDRQKEINKTKSLKTRELHEFFLQIWDEREDEQGYCYCFESNTPMHRNKYRENTSVYDHVLEKQSNAYPQYAFTKKNIIIVLPKIHAQKGTDITKTPKILEYRNKLITLHEINEL